MKTRETHENVLECTRMCMSYLLLSECRYFALSRKNNQRNDYKN